MRITISTERLVSRQQNAYYEKDRKHSGARVDFNLYSLEWICSASAR